MTVDAEEIATQKSRKYIHSSTWIWSFHLWFRIPADRKATMIGYKKYL